MMAGAEQRLTLWIGARVLLSYHPRPWAKRICGA
ncbi:protein of unknown function (plasmid) [Azospirillum baldaniorum]|uniref:Uncharacterized protein n=1 Tax=Azospirillum baldaniorum TaxID=1064539 RepID=A0A9P1NNZ4_9PROT|nr:protein of unknown function [Azospirillum baldaniorum]